MRNKKETCLRSLDSRKILFQYVNLPVLTSLISWIAQQIIESKKHPDVMQKLISSHFISNGKDIGFRIQILVNS